VSQDAPDMTLVARLIRPHGRRGELIADLLTDFPERFKDRRQLILLPGARLGTQPRPAELEDFWFLRSRVVFKFRGVDSINDAELLRGFGVAIPTAERAPLEDGAVYISDLTGCRVFDLNQNGSEIGEIVDVDRSLSSAELLVVRRDPAPGPGDEVLIPFVRQFLVTMDLPGRRIEMRLPEGLLEINAPMDEAEKRESGKRADADSAEN
jgi:16S rRNA processing protein RimM